MSNIQPVSNKTIKAIKKALEGKPPLPFFTPTGKEGESKILSINNAISKIGAKIELIYAGEEHTLYLWEHGIKGGTLTILCKNLEFAQINSDQITCVRSIKDLHYN